MEDIKLVIERVQLDNFNNEAEVFFEHLKKTELYANQYGFGYPIEQKKSRGDCLAHYRLIGNSALNGYTLYISKMYDVQTNPYLFVTYRSCFVD